MPYYNSLEIMMSTMLVLPLLQYLRIHLEPSTGHQDLYILSPDHANITLCPANISPKSERQPGPERSGTTVVIQYVFSDF